MKNNKFTEKELIDKLIQLSGKKLFLLLKKYGVDPGPGWDSDYYEWEEELNLAQIVVDKIPYEKIVEELKLK